MDAAFVFVPDDAQTPACHVRPIVGFPDRPRTKLSLMLSSAMRFHLAITFG